MKKPSLSKKNKAKRLAWCKKQRNWNAQDWKRIIYTDKCKVQIMSKSRKYVRRPTGMANHPKYIQETVKFPKSVMVWGAIRKDGKRCLIRVAKNVDSNEYQQILTAALSQVYSSRFFFQQDGASAHTSVSTMNYFVEKQIRMLAKFSTSES